MRPPRGWPTGQTALGPNYTATCMHVGAARRFQAARLRAGICAAAFATHRWDR